jgi:hypothetical protein
MRGESRHELKDAAALVGRCCRWINPARVLRSLGKAALRLLAAHAQVKVRRAAVLAWALAMPTWKLAEHLLEAAVLPVGVQGTVTVYVSSVDGSDADNGSTWALANATITGGLADATDGTFNFIYVDSAHSASPSAAITYTGTSGSFTAIISVDRNGSTTTGHNGWLAGADETVGNNNAAFTIGGGTASHKLFLFGLTLSGNSGASGGNTLALVGTTGSVGVELAARSCTFSTPGNGATRIFIGPPAGTTNNTQLVRLESCVLTTHQNTAAGIQIRKANVTMVGCTHTFAGATKAAVLFDFIQGTAPTLTILDSDLSGFDAGNYFDVTNIQGPVTLVNVKRHATPGLKTGTWADNSGSITIIDADGGFEYCNRLGTLTESASVYANNGFTRLGTNYSWQIVTTAACSEQEPFVTPWAMRPSDDTAEIDVGFEIVHDSATDVHNRNLWPEIEYVSAASLGTLSSGRNAEPFDGTAVDWTNTATTWTGTGGMTNSNEQGVYRTFTPFAGSLLRGRLAVGEASKTLYVDPLLRIV